MYMFQGLRVDLVRGFVDLKLKETKTNACNLQPTLSRTGRSYRLNIWVDNVFIVDVEGNVDP